MLAWRPARRLRWEIVCFVLAGGATAFLTLQAAAPLWELPVLGAVLGFAQFPWRWFSVATLCLAALAGLPMLPDVHSSDRRSLLALAAVAGLVLLGSYPLLRVEITEPAEGPVGLAALMRFQQSSDEMTGSTAWVKEIPTWSPMADEYISKDRAGEPVTPVASMVDYTTLNYHRETGFVVNSEARTSVMEEAWYWSPLEGRRIVYNQFYYPGWRAYLLNGPDGEPVQELEIVPEEEGTLGRMTVPVPVGEGYVLLRFEDTTPAIAGRWISWATAAVLIGAGVARWSRREGARREAGALGSPIVLKAFSALRRSRRVQTGMPGRENATSYCAPDNMGRGGHRTCGATGTGLSCAQDPGRQYIYSYRWRKDSDRR